GGNDPREAAKTAACSSSLNRTPSSSSFSPRTWAALATSRSFSIADRPTDGARGEEPDRTDAVNNDVAQGSTTSCAAGNWRWRRASRIDRGRWRRYDWLMR